jgi:hypothetical protein
MSAKPEEAALPSADRPVEELNFWGPDSAAALDAGASADGAEELDDEPAPVETM